MRLVASSHRLDSSERFDRLIHGLAQLGDSVTLAIWGDGPGRQPLVDLADAYGIGERLEFVPESVPDPRIAIYPSFENAESAPLRPTDADKAFILDPAAR